MNPALPQTSNLKRFLCPSKVGRDVSTVGVGLDRGDLRAHVLGQVRELIRRVTRCRIARMPVQIFKPALDVRFGENRIVSHSDHAVEAIPVSGSEDLLRQVEDATLVVGIDEGQFFDEGLVDVAERLAAAGKQVIVAGLDTDYLRRPFEPIPSLCGRAEFVTKMLAVCHKCGGPGLFTQRTVRSDDLVVLGAEGAYEARCRSCYDPMEAEQPAFALGEVGSG